MIIFIDWPALGLRRTQRRTVTHFEERDLTDYLPLVQFAINTSVHTGSKHTPHFTVFGTEASNPVLFGTFEDGREEPPEDIAEFVQFQEVVITVVRDCLNGKLRDVTSAVGEWVLLAVGEWVLLSATNLAAHHFQRREHKFRPAFIGPFRITEQVTDYTYRLDLP